MSKPEDISQEAWDRADDMAFYDPATEDRDGSISRYKLREAIARAIMAAKAEERARWEPAAIYFERYCQDEADEAENCVCGEVQHEDAKAFADVVADVNGAYKNKLEA